MLTDGTRREEARLYFVVARVAFGPYSKDRRAGRSFKALIIPGQRLYRTAMMSSSQTTWFWCVRVRVPVFFSSAHFLPDTSICPFGPQAVSVRQDGPYKLGACSELSCLLSHQWEEASRVVYDSSVLCFRVLSSFFSCCCHVDLKWVCVCL